VSRLRARCPDCRALTAVALGAEYQCHACGRAFAAATLRVEGTPDLALPYPEAAVAARSEPDLAGILPQRPIVLGGDADFHERVRAALPAAGEYLLVERTEALAELPPPERPQGIGFAEAVAEPANADAIARFLAALGL
jgi:hypothetical protein